MNQMKPQLTARIFCLMIAAALAGCALAPVPTVSMRDTSVARPESAMLQRLPTKVYGVLQELGVADAVPDVAPMIEYQALRKQLRSAEASRQRAAPQWTALGPGNNLGRVIDIAFNPQNSNIIYPVYCFKRRQSGI